MPMFYFDIVEVDGTISSDTVGVELPNEAEAKREAKRWLADLARDAIYRDDISEIRVIVRNVEGERVDIRLATLKDEPDYPLRGRPFGK